MEKIVYNKLVRDGVPDKIVKNGGKCKVRNLSRDGHIQCLFAKTEEERLEFISAQTTEDRLAEAADIITVILKLWELVPITYFDQKQARQEFRRVYQEGEHNFHAELEQHTISLQNKLGNKEEIARATAGQVEALLCLIDQDGFTIEHLNKQIGLKHKQSGGFDKGYFLVWATSP